MMTVTMRLSSQSYGCHFWSVTLVSLCGKNAAQVSSLCLQLQGRGEKHQVFPLEIQDFK
jgi:hypothetical protein